MIIHTYTIKIFRFTRVGNGDETLVSRHVLDKMYKRFDVLQENYHTAIIHQSEYERTYDNILLYYCMHIL